jgi:ABC-type glycerol-3-phosphate transport system substrate-binding protein
VRQVLEIWQSLQTKGYFVTDSWTWGYSEAMRAIIRGDDALIRPREPAAMVLSNASRFDETPSKFRNELNFFPFPIIDPSVPVAEVVPSMGYMISANSSYPSEAMEFLTYVGSVEAQSRFFQQMSSLGTYLPVQNGIRAKLFAPAMQQGMTIVQGADSIGNSFYASIPGLMRGSVSGVILRLLRGSTDIDSLLSDLEAARKRVY